MQVVAQSLGVVLNKCDGHRTGPLCGDCLDTYVEAVGSAQCVLQSTCDERAAEVRLAGAVVLMLSAVLQLTLVSGVWNGASSPPTNKIKLALYFFQVSLGHRLGVSGCHWVWFSVASGLGWMGCMGLTLCTGVRLQYEPCSCPAGGV